MARYGNFMMGAPNFTEDINALKDLLEKNEITKKEHDKKKELFRAIRLKYIVLTNGGYTEPKKKNAKDENTLNDIKNKYLAERVLAYREQLLQKENEVVEGGETVEAETPELHSD